MTHFLIKCDKCEKVIAQCRCPSKDKAVQYQTCDECNPEKVEKNKMIGGVDDET